MKRWLSFLAALVIFAILHEGLHAVFARFLGEYQAFRIRLYGLEVTFNTPSAEQEGFQRALISGMSNLITILVSLSRSHKFENHSLWEVVHRK